MQLFAYLCYFATLLLWRYSVWKLNDVILLHAHKLAIIKNATLYCNLSSKQVYLPFVIERKVHTVQRTQPSMMARVVTYLESYGEQGFDPLDPSQIVGIAQAKQEHHKDQLSDITGVIALHFPVGSDDTLEISHLRTVQEHGPLLDWAARNAQMVGRSTLHIVTNPRDITLLTEQYQFIQNGSPFSLVKQLDGRTIG